MSTPGPTSSTSQRGHDLVVVANRLPVDQVGDDPTHPQWQRSPGGLVTALAPVMQETGGAWVGWSGAPGPAPAPFHDNGMHLVPVGLSTEEVRDYYEGFANATLWPLYHDVIAPPEFHRHWWRAYREVNHRFAAAAAEQAAPGATVWVHDYQLQLVPALLRGHRPDLRIGWFNHIPFPGYEIFAQLPWRRQVVEGLLGADLLGFQRPSDVTNFLRACRRAAHLPTRGALVRVPQPDAGRTAAGVPVTAAGGTGWRSVRAAAYPISIDASFGKLAQREDVQARARAIRAALGSPRTMVLGVDRLDYTKGILHRLKAYGELLDDGELSPPETVLVQVASPSRERVEQYQVLRDEVEQQIGRINGDHGLIGHPAVHYLHHSHPQEEMAALYLAADVLLVTALRDGMNLVAKEYVACRHDETGALVLSEFTGAADELTSAFLVNPHDIDALKQTICTAVRVSLRDAARRMRNMRSRVRTHDVQAWAATFLAALRAAGEDPAGAAS